MSGDFNNVSLSWPRSNADTTTFGNDTTQRISGIRDVKVSYAGIWNGGANKVDAVLQPLMNGSIVTLLKIVPASIAGCAFYTGCFLINDYGLTGTVTDAVGVTAAFEHASGSLTASTV